MIKSSFEKMAFLGEKAADSRFVNKVNTIKDKLNVALNPTDPVAEKKINGATSEVVKSLTESGEWSCDSVKSLMETVKDPTRSANRNVAKERLDVLANSMYIVMTHGENEDLRLAVGTKDGATIDAALPDSLKGIGGRISEIATEQEITNPKLKEALKKLDRRAEILRASGTIGEEKLRELVGDKILELSDMVEELDDRGYEELTRVSAYLGAEANKMAERADERRSEEGGGRDEVVSQTDRRTKRGAYDHRTYGQAEGMEGVVPIPIPGEQLVSIEQVNDEDKAKKWITSTFVKMSENPLFFANWWQQGTADQAISMIIEQLEYSMHDDEYARMRDYVYATVSVLGLQTVDRNADANSDSYGQFTPPKNMGGFLHWDNGGKYYDALRNDSEIKNFYTKIFDTAFDYNGAKDIVEAFSDGAGYDSQNKYLKSLLENQLFAGRNSKDKDLLNKGRVAMAIFEVDFMPEWIRWLNESKKYFAENNDINNYQKLDWLSSFRDIDGIQNPTMGKYDTFAYSVKLTVEKENQEGKYVKVTELGYEHPRVLRPWDVAAGAKGSYRDRPEIIRGMERVLVPFIARRLSNKDGNWITAHGDNAIDLYSKYGKFMSKVFGGSQGTEFDNLTSLEEILPLAANFWGKPGAPTIDSKTGEVIETVEQNRERFGSFLSELFALKTDAMFYPGYKSNAKSTLHAIEGLDLFSGEMEKKKALEGALGPNADIAHGWVAEVRRLYNIDLLALDRNGYPKYPRFHDAYLRVFIDTPDIKEARKYYNKALWVTKRKGYGEAGSFISNLVSIWTK